MERPEVDPERLKCHCEPGEACPLGRDRSDGSRCTCDDLLAVCQRRARLEHERTRRALDLLASPYSRSAR